jgi:hypothetical protein
MDKTFTNVIYLDKQSNKFAFVFILLFLLVPNITVLLGLLVIYGPLIVKNNTVLLYSGIYTILNTMTIVFCYFSLENNKEKTIRLLDEGLIYNSMVKKFAVPWTCVYRIKVNPFLSARPAIFVYTTKGRFYFTGMYVNLAEELPKIKPGILRPKFYYQSGGAFDSNIYNNELYLTLKEKIPDKFF